jgi:hypothetical protein
MIMLLKHLQEQISLSFLKSYCHFKNVFDSLHSHHFIVIKCEFFSYLGVKSKRQAAGGLKLFRMKEKDKKSDKKGFKGRKSVEKISKLESSPLPLSPPPPLAAAAPRLAPALSTTTTTTTTTTLGSSSRDSSDVRNLIKQQAANGSFNLSALQSQIPKVTMNDIDRILKELNIVVNEKTELILITVLVTLVFVFKYGNQKTLWDLVVTKAKNWVKKEMVKENIKPDINLEETGKKFLATHGISS